MGFKYGAALKHLLPWRCRRKDDSSMPSNDAGLFSFFSINWLSGLMWKAYKTGLQQEDLWNLHRDDCAEVNCSRLERLWEKEQNLCKPRNIKPQLSHVVWHFMKTRVIITMLISSVQNVLQFLAPSLILKIILDYIESPEPLDYNILGWIAGGISLLYLIRGACTHAMYVVAVHTAVRTTGAIQGVIYKKLLKLRTGGDKLSAKVLNFCNNDMERIFEAAIAAAMFPAIPLTFIMSLVYCLRIIGPLSLLGQAVFLLFYPVLFCILKAQVKIRISTIKITDQRVTLMKELLNNIRFIKMYSWEEAFNKKVSEVRNQEVKKHKIAAFLQAISSTVTPSISILATIVTILGYTLFGNNLKPSEAFTIFSVFNAMQYVFLILPYTIRTIAEAKVSLMRIQELLDLPEHSKICIDKRDSIVALEMINASFAWETPNIESDEKLAGNFDQKLTKTNEPSIKNSIHGDKTEDMILSEKEKKEEKLSENEKLLEEENRNENNLIVMLKNFNVKIERGKLIGICGSIGSGKSSLVSAICGDMKLQHGSMQINGSLALVTQQAWIYNSTLRDNIIVGKEIDHARYQQVLNVCALESDLKLLLCGDMTEMGDHGSNLSGGQKQRVNLARAVYSDRDIYLLDDPLSAVDTKVAQYIFTNCIQKMLKDKTIIFISNFINFLEKCDEIIVLNDGTLVEHGTHGELLMKKGNYFTMASFDSTRDCQAQEETENAKSTEDIDLTTGIDNSEDKINDKIINKKKQASKGKLIKEEKKSQGKLDKKIYTKLFQASGGCCVGILILIALVIFTLAKLFNVIWLRKWLDDGDGNMAARLNNITNLSSDELKGEIILNPHLWIYQLVYGLSFALIILTGIIKAVGLTFRILAGSTKLHNTMLRSILQSPMCFFDTTPSGRILTRFSRDLDLLDIRIPYFLEMVLQGFLLLLSEWIMVCIFYYWFFIPVTIIFGIFIFMDNFLNAGVREIKRLDNVLKSPIIQHIGSSVSGLSVIRTYDKEEIFHQRFYKHLDKHSSALLVSRLSQFWYSYRNSLIADIMIVLITILALLNKGTVSPAIAGLALSTMNGMCVSIPILMGKKVELQSLFTSVERIIEYAYELKSEYPTTQFITQVDRCWPSSGAIILNGVKLRYREGLPLVLNGVTANIKPGEKVGIIGRTGAGKSSLITSLLRLVELSSGSIAIDGKDINYISLQKLRSSISVIPQDPVLFQGTIRYNLDPLDEHSDELVWKALEQSHLKASISQMAKGIQTEVDAGGENFSVGERQLICLTRALLRNNKILLLDEATASVDIETDHLIQNTIKSAFGSCTVLTIAHRLNTVANYDRIMALDAGMVKEFDTPETLMKKEDSLFREMMLATGISNVEQFK